MALLPEVKLFEKIENTVQLKYFQSLKGNTFSPVLLKQLKSAIPGLAVSKGAKGCCAELCVPGKKSGLKAEDPGNGNDAYVIQISTNGIRIDSKTPAGVFYGFQTLLQMPEKLPCGTVKDEAAVPLRMIHWDLKGYQPKFEILLEELEILASYKVNAILLELEDKYDYKCAPGIGCPTAFSFDEMRKISKYAADLHIMIVPKLQSIAHVDYMLKQPQYRDLRENEHCYQFCCSSTKVDKLWNKMADELMECFAEHPIYFHVGADEATYLGECPKCKKLGVVGSYLRRTGKSIDHIIASGRTPIMWDDILRNSAKGMSDEQAKECWSLGKKSILMYWDYGYGGKGNTFSFLRSYIDAGMRVWGASGYAGCDNWAGSLPPLEYRGLNSCAWTKSAVENKLECVCSTGWGRIGSADCPAEPHESSWFTILYAACNMWSGKTIDYTKFIYELSMNLYGECPDQALVNAILNIGKSPYTLQNVLDKQFSSDRYSFLQLAAAAESLSVIRNMFCNWNQFYYGKLGNCLEDYRIEYMNRWPVMHAGNVAKFKKMLEPVLRHFYGTFTADDFLNSRFGYLEKLIDDTMKLTEKTKKM
jgi:hypothetical protein